MTDNSKFYHIGAGEAQVYNPAPIVGAFNQILAKQQAQRQLELKQLTDQQAQLKPDGLRNDADRKDFFNQANDWRQKSINAMNERDPYKKSLLQSQAQQAYMQAQSTVAQSKAQAAKDLQFNQFAMNDATRHQLTDDAVTKGLANAEVGVNDPRLIKEYSSLQRQVDHKKIMDNLDKADKEALKQTPWGTPTLKDAVVAGRKATFINNSRTLDPADRAKMYSQMYDTDRDTKKFFNDVYPQFYNDPSLTPEQQKQAAIGQYIKDSGDVSEYSAPQEKAALAPNYHNQNRLFDIAHPLPNQAQSGALTPAQILIAGNPQQGQAGMLQGNTDAMKRIVALTPKGQYGTAKVSDPVIDPNTGEHVFHYPAQVKPDEKAIAQNKVLKDRYAKSPEKEGSILGFGGTPIPFEKSSNASKLVPEYKVIKPAQEYRLNPADPQGYVSQAAQMAEDQHIKLPQLNQILGGKGGRGMIEPQKGSSKANSYQHIQQAKDSKGNTVNLGLKNGKWYNTATNQPVE